jgi:hypothetical protein
MIIFLIFIHCTMLNTYSNHLDYLNSCALYIFAIVVNVPQFNNYWDMGELVDIYFRKFVSNNKHLSKRIANDCRDIIELVENSNYIKLIKNSFDNVDDAYHYLAMTTQFYRIGNRYDLIIKDPYNMCDLNNAYCAIRLYIE